MKGVKFTEPMPPSHGTGDTALLPDELADMLITDRKATAYAFPAQPHAHEAGYEPPANRAIDKTVPPRRETLSLKKK